MGEFLGGETRAITQGFKLLGNIQARVNHEVCHDVRVLGIQVVVVSTLIKQLFGSAAANKLICSYGVMEKDVMQSDADTVRRALLMFTSSIDRLSCSEKAMCVAQPPASNVEAVVRAGLGRRVATTSK
jgi:hypothetical protein